MILLMNRRWMRVAVGAGVCLVVGLPPHADAARTSAVSMAAPSKTLIA